MAEYRALREKFDLLTICRTPELSVQVTLQPLKRFDLDAAILFSDIMVPLQGMGVKFDIAESVGPVITEPVRDSASVNRLRVLEPETDVPYVLEAIRILRRELEGRLPLIGFAGAPFTLASYLIEGRASRDLLLTKTFMYTNPAGWHALMNKLADTVTAYLLAQIRAGVQAVQLFDSWVGVLSPRDYREYVLPHSNKIFFALAPGGVPRIHFGTGTATLLDLMKEAGGDVFGIDWRIPLGEAWSRLGDTAVQGNLDPSVLMTTPEIVQDHARRILAEANRRPGHIFNLGHGVLPKTPMENVEQLIETVHAYALTGAT